MTLIALSSLLATGRAGNHAVALRSGEPLQFGSFAADVAGLAARAATLGPKRAALLCHGSYAFTVGLYGLLQNDCDIVLPPNGQPGTLDALRDQFELLVDDDFVRATAPAATADHTCLNAARPSLHFFTSGSTGEPKRIVKTLAMLEREIAALDSLWGDTIGSGTVFATVPHQHIYGLTFKVLWPLAAGRAFADETENHWENLLARMTPNGTLVSGPAHLSRLAGLSPLPIARCPSRIFSAGAPLSNPAAIEATKILGRRPTEIFGSTETGAIATREQSTGHEPWHVLPGITIGQCDDGRLTLRSPWVGDDWFETADVIEPVPGGFQFLGRADRIVKIEGKRISLPEIEQSLIALPWVRHAATTVLPGPPRRLAAVVVLNEQGRERLTTLGDFRFGRLLRTALATTQEAAGMPRVWRFVDDLPSQNGLGKHRDRDIRTLFEMTP